MHSFLAYIAEQYGRKKEDVATDALAYLLNRSKAARVAFGGFVEELGYSLPRTYSIVSRTRGVNGVPDLRFSDGDDSCCLIVENKFWAGLTTNQPVGYLNELRRDGGLILFVVPEVRIEKLWGEVRKRCGEVNRVVEPLPGKKFSGRSARDLLCVVSWRNLISHLRDALDKTELPNSEAAMFIDQLRRICEVAETEYVDAFEPIEISSKRLGQRVKDCSYLAIAIATAAEEKLLFSPFPDSKQKSWESCGAGWSGRWGNMAEYAVWIGFDAAQWSTHAISPLWLWFEDRNDVDELFELFDQEIKAARCFEIDRPKGKRALAFPIPLTPGVQANEIVEGAVDWLREIASRLSSLSKDL